MHKHTRITLGTVGALALALSLVACSTGGHTPKPSGSDPTGEPTELITVNYSAPVPGALPFLPVDIAAAQGFFEEEGIELVVTQTSAQALPAALTSGQIDMTADTAYNVGRYLENGVEVRFVSGLNDNVDFTLLAADGVDIPGPDEVGGWRASIEALRGLRIGTAAQAGPIGLTVAALLEEAGVEEGEYTFVDTPGAAAGNALEAGQVDAVFSGGGFDAPLVANGLATHVLSLGTDIPDIFGDQVNAALTMTATFIEENPEAPARVQRAIARAMEYIQDPANIDSVVADAIASGTPETDELAEKIQSYAYSAALSIDGIQAALEWANRAGISSTVIDANDSIAEGVETV
ncbi:hypothetical protein GCM10025768_00360 [Microbacterium pseudoresistens]|uniref:ABC-type nitrate/sulfonate/bicarbonate transport system substrate-binding protein n=1 Tax=Microbacterium pseudoresistens TaxID=640634 RepID=A0A7Y9JLM6_9MICO|nr:ABC transporter substrate-binding protein [Microbacterium pseudoresistens]NYD53872.1 ABC-type nitrate/sulfonate/bicarbonate transport system substrate-binding protein [Microbacterium pseudoresistens]